MSFKTSTISLVEYLKNTKQPFLKATSNHENSKKVSIITKSKELSKSLALENEQTEMEEQTPTHAAKKIKLLAKKKYMQELEENWKGKPLHGKYPERISKPDIDSKLTHMWLQGTGLKAETEGFIIAAQDQSLPTRNYKANIIKDGSDPMC